jgi:hypothetical protein
VSDEPFTQTVKLTGNKDDCLACFQALDEILKSLIISRCELSETLKFGDIKEVLSSHKVCSVYFMERKDDIQLMAIGSSAAERV